MGCRGSVGNVNTPTQPNEFSESSVGKFIGIGAGEKMLGVESFDEWDRRKVTNLVEFDERF